MKIKQQIIDYILVCINVSFLVAIHENFRTLFHYILNTLFWQKYVVEISNFIQFNWINFYL